MSNYLQINLLDLSKEIGYEKTYEIISGFTCNQNLEVEDFLRLKALNFSEQRIASTYLIFSPYKEEPALVGYFALSHNYFLIDSKKLNDMSKRLAKRISKFTRNNKELNRYAFSAPLIG